MREVFFLIFSISYISRRFPNLSSSSPSLLYYSKVFPKLKIKLNELIGKIGFALSWLILPFLSQQYIITDGITDGKPQALWLGFLLGTLATITFMYSATRKIGIEDSRK